MEPEAEIGQDEIRPLITQAFEVALTRGVIMRGKNQGEASTEYGGLNVDHARFTLWPSGFPKTHYTSLLQAQMDFNLLLDKMSRSKTFLLDSLQQ